jgi:hypothetical protein
MLDGREVSERFSGFNWDEGRASIPAMGSAPGLESTWPATSTAALVMAEKWRVVIRCEVVFYGKKKWAAILTALGSSRPAPTVAFRFTTVPVRATNAPPAVAEPDVPRVRRLEG